MENLHYFANDDITTAILSRLPAKILLKFRSVSKSWRDIIDSSGLRNLHVQNQLSNDNSNVDDDAVLLQLMPRPDKHLSGQVLKMISIMILDFPSYKDFLSSNDMSHNYVVFSGQAHGLICFYRNVSRNPIGLCNPLLKKMKILPESPLSRDHNIRHVGLGYDEVERDFKVVQLSTHFRQQRTDVEVYSRKQDKWREVGDHPLHRDILIMRRVQSSSCRGAYAHWYATDLSETEFIRNIVVSFDMRNEVLKTIMIPRFGNTASGHGVLAKEDSLVVFVSYQEVVIMWEYKLSNDSKRGEWIKTGSLGAFDGRVWPLMWWKSGEILVLRVYSYKTRCYKIVYYDCCSGQIVRCIDTDFVRLVQYNRPTFTSP